jgi:regulator of protease activity HflC (stomatin/prohibitin superfamily)
MHQTYLLAATNLEMSAILFALASVVAFVVWALVSRVMRWLDVHFPYITIFEFQKAVRYHRGQFTGIVGPSQFRYRTATTHFTVIEMREQTLTIPGQEVLTADALGIKLSLQCNWQVTDPIKAVTVVESYGATLYADIHAATRSVIQALTTEQVLADRGNLARQIEALAQASVSRYGLQINALSVRDCMLPGPLKQIYAKVAEARQEGLAALERARGESAALRNLANAARTVQNTPGLGLLRLIQTLETAQGNKIVLDATELLRLKAPDTTPEPEK